MRRDEIVELGTKLGLKFDLKTNYVDAFAKGRVVFDGCNGQRFLVEADWDDDKVIETLGKSLILYGRRLQKMEIHKALSITSDYE